MSPSSSTAAKPAARSLAVVTGASTGVGQELARLCAGAGFDLVIAADRGPLDEVALELREAGAAVDPVRADLATPEGIEKLWEVIGGRAVDALIANAAQGSGHAFLDQDFAAARRVVDSDITGTLDLLHRVGRAMRDRGRGQILVTGALAAPVPGALPAVSSATRAFIDTFSHALREELKEAGVAVTVLAADPAAGGDAEALAGWKDSVLALLASVTPSGVLAEQHRKLAEAGSAEIRIPEIS